MGAPSREIDASWGSQRIKGLSVSAVIRDIAGKLFHIKNRKIETPLIEGFSYSKLGPGQLWELSAEEVRKLGGSIIMEAQVTKIH